MTELSAHTALLLFAGTAEEEVCHKVLLPGQNLKKQKALFNLLNTKAEHALKETNLPYYVFRQSDQLGATFGQRLYAAVAAVFIKGYKNVLVIGNDCPALGTAAILNATGKLSRQGVVLGPTDKGGVYLLGINQTIFSKLDNLDNIRWQTPHVIQDLEAVFRLQEVAITYLKLNTDLNKPADLTKVVVAGYAAPVLRKLYYASLTNNKFRLSQPNSTWRYSFPAISHLVFRGPPQLG